MSRFTTSALLSLFLKRASVANKQKSNAEVRGLGALCVCVHGARGLIARCLAR
jgi:hypothetical protein